MVPELYGGGFGQTRTRGLSCRLPGIMDSRGNTVLRQLGCTRGLRGSLTGITDGPAPANPESFGHTLREHLMAAAGP